MNRHQRIYARIIKLVPDIMGAPLGTAWKLRTTGDIFMPLCVEVVEVDHHHVVVSLAHYYEQNGDLVADPEMTVRLYRHKMAEALTFHMPGAGLYQEVYGVNDAGQITVRPRLKHELNAFLDTWTNNIRQQGHKLPVELQAA